MLPRELWRSSTYGIPVLPWGLVIDIYCPLSRSCLSHTPSYITVIYIIRKIENTSGAGSWSTGQVEGKGIFMLQSGNRFIHGVWTASCPSCLEPRETDDTLREVWMVTRNVLSHLINETPWPKTTDWILSSYCFERRREKC